MREKCFESRLPLSVVTSVVRTLVTREIVSKLQVPRGGHPRARPAAQMPFDVIHDPDAAAKAKAEAEAAEAEAHAAKVAKLIKEQERAMVMHALETPEKDASEVTPEPPGAPDSWPIAFMPDGEDICGNGGVLKQLRGAGIEALGKPPADASVQVAYQAFTMQGVEWDSSARLSFRLGDLYVNRVLEAAAASMGWGETASFVCTPVYAKGNNASRRPLPEGCVRYELTLLSWRERQLRDGTSRYKLADGERADEVVRLKAQAAALVKAGCLEVARDIYQDCRYYIEPTGREGQGEDLVPPEGREEECQALLLAVWLNDAVCSFKIGVQRDEATRDGAADFRRTAELGTKALEHAVEGRPTPLASRVKALYYRGVARARLHDFTDAQADLLAAAKLDPKSRDVRQAIALLREQRAAASKRDAKFAGRSLGNPAHDDPHRL